MLPNTTKICDICVQLPLWSPTYLFMRKHTRDFRTSVAKKYTSIN